MRGDAVDAVVSPQGVKVVCPHTQRQMAQKEKLVLMAGIELATY